MPQDDTGPTCADDGVAVHASDAEADAGDAATHDSQRAGPSGHRGAEDKLDQIGSASFDEAARNGTVSSRSELTAGPPFSDGGPDNDDIDDFHGEPAP